MDREWQFCQTHKNYFRSDSECGKCLECAEESKRLARDADRAQWRRYAEAAPTQAPTWWVESWTDRNGRPIYDHKVREMYFAWRTEYADAMLAADKAKWEGE